MNQPLSGKAIIEKCRERVEASTGKKATWTRISVAIKAKTQVSIDRQYLYRLYHYDGKMKQKHRATFAQFLELELEDIALFTPSYKFTITRTAQSGSEFNQLSLLFIKTQSKGKNHVKP